MKTKVIIRENDFSQETKDRMWRIYKEYYNYSRESFMERTSKNNYYAMYYNGKNLVGFTGLRIDDIKTTERSSLLIYFGQTVITNAARGMALIPITGFKLCMRYFSRLIRGQVIFWADALSYKAYLVFAKSLDVCFPSYRMPNPDSINQIISHLGRKHYGQSFCTLTGTVKKNVKFVNDPSTYIRKQDLKDPDIRFFKMANPMHTKGHGLITLGPMDRRNFASLVRKLLRRMLGLKKKGKSTLKPPSPWKFVKE